MKNKSGRTHELQKSTERVTISKNEKGKNPYGQSIPFDCEICLHEPARYGIEGHWICAKCHIEGTKS